MAPTSDDIQVVSEILQCEPNRARALLTQAGSVEGAVNLGLAGGPDIMGGAIPSPREDAAGDGDLQTPLLPVTPARGWRKVVSCICRFALTISSAIGRFFTTLFERRSFDEEWERRYGPHPVFTTGTFRGALSKSRDEGKLLVVYLHCEASARTAPFCREVLAHDAVRALIDADYLFWASDIMTMEAHEVSRALNVREYPSIFIMQGTAGTPQVEAELHGVITVDALIAQLTHHAEGRVNLPTGSARDIRNVQDQEYAEALAIDARREAERERAATAEREEIERAEKAQADERAAAESEQARQRSLSMQIAERREALAVKFRARAPPPAPTVRLQLRASSGRAQADFAASATLVEVKEWAEATQVMNGLDIPNEFALVRSYPAETLDDFSKTLEALGLAPSAALLVRDLSD